MILTLDVEKVSNNNWSKNKYIIFIMYIGDINVYTLYYHLKSKLEVDV